jgi:hypothetical protein
MKRSSFSVQRAVQKAANKSSPWKYLRPIPTFAPPPATASGFLSEKRNNVLKDHRWPRVEPPALQAAISLRGTPTTWVGTTTRSVPSSLGRLPRLDGAPLNGLGANEVISDPQSGQHLGVPRWHQHHDCRFRPLRRWHGELHQQIRWK